MQIRDSGCLWTNVTQVTGRVLVDTSGGDVRSLTPVAGAALLVHVDLNSFTTGATQATGLAPLWACEGMCSLLLQVRRSWSTLTMPSSLWGPQYSARISPGHTAGALIQATAQHSEHAHLPSSLWGSQYSARISPGHTAGVSCTGNSTAFRACPLALWLVGPALQCARISPGHTAGTLAQGSVQTFKAGPPAHKHECACQPTASLKAIVFASADSCVRDTCSRAQGNGTSSHVQTQVWGA